MIDGFRYIASKAKVAMNIYTKFGIEGYDADRTEVRCGNCLLPVKGHEERQKSREVKYLQFHSEASLTEVRKVY
jgi:hypothetical protein